MGGSLDDEVTFQPVLIPNAPICDLLPRPLTVYVNAEGNAFYQKIDAQVHNVPAM